MSASCAVRVMSSARTSALSARTPVTSGPVRMRASRSDLTVRMLSGRSAVASESMARSSPRPSSASASSLTTVERSSAGTAPRTSARTSTVLPASGGGDVCSMGTISPAASCSPSPGVTSTTRSPIGLRLVIWKSESFGTVVPLSRVISTRAPSSVRSTSVTAPTFTPRIVTSLRSASPPEFVNSARMTGPPVSVSSSCEIPRAIRAVVDNRKMARLMMILLLTISRSLRIVAPDRPGCR